MDARKVLPKLFAVYPEIIQQKNKTIIKLVTRFFTMLTPMFASFDV